MINWEKTIEKIGYDKSYFDKYPKSHKKVYRICDGCSKEDLVDYSSQHFLLCGSCSQIKRTSHGDVSGKNNPMYGKHHSESAKKLQSNAAQGKYVGELNPNFGKPMSDEQKEKLRIANTGKHHTQSQKDKWSRDRVGKGNSRYGIHCSDETKKKISIANSGDKSGMWKGGIADIRNHVLPFSQCLKINKYFKGSHRHHISADVIIYIPRDLHYHIDHSLKDGKGMSEMNLLSLQFIKGEL